ERAQLIEALSLTRHTERTICDRQLLAAELDRIAANGYALDNEEYVIGVACVAVPVRTADGEVVAAVAGPAAPARPPPAPAQDLSTERRGAPSSVDPQGGAIFASRLKPGLGTAR